MARKQKKYHYIYKTINLLSGKYYIGMHSTNNLDDGYLGSGTRLRYSINKHGKDNHKLEILEFCDSREELKSREEEIVNLNEIAKVDCMNLKVGGYGGFISVEQQKHRSKCGGKANAERLKNDLEYAKQHSERSSKLFSKTHKLGKIKTGKDAYDWSGKKHSDKVKKKISESKKGKGKGSDNSQFGSCWITNEKINKKIMRGDEIPKGFRLGRKMK